MIPSVYPITDTHVSGLPHLEQVRRLIAGGATLIQLRDKESSPRDFYTQALQCVAYARPLGVKIIINDRADIAMMTDADGVHLGQDDMPPDAARRLLGPDKLIGYSTHSVAQAVVAATMTVDYIAIGPVFETTTKSDADTLVGIEGVSKVRAAIGDMPLVAIGGIDVSNIADVLATGANSAAVISGVLADPAGIEASMGSILQIAER